MRMIAHVCLYIYSIYHVCKRIPLVHIISAMASGDFGFSRSEDEQL